jgi:hypothetical protein
VLVERVKEVVEQTSSRYACVDWHFPIFLKYIFFTENRSIKVQDVMSAA